MATITAVGADQLRIREDPVYRKIAKPVRHWGTRAPDDGVNLGAYYVSVSSGDVQPWHHHVFEQIRFIKSGSMTYGHNRTAVAGDCVYFPESVAYGPVSYEDGEFLLIQWPGPSEGGLFFAVDDVDAAAAEMKKTMGSFELDKGGLFRHHDGRLQDGYEAVAEYLSGEPLRYAPPRYLDQALMRTTAFAACPLPGADGVLIKHLGYFNEVGPNVKLLSFEAGATLPAAASQSQQVWSVLSGELGYDGRSFGDRSLLHIERGAQRARAVAPVPAEVLVVHLGRPGNGPIPFASTDHRHGGRLLAAPRPLNAHVSDPTLAPPAPVARLGLTVPFGGSIGLQQPMLAAASKAGFTDLWSGEVNGVDAFTPLAAAAVAQPGFRLGTAIVSAFTRSPAVLAMSTASLCQLSSGPVAIGIGASSNVIVEQWNGVPFKRPLQRVADVVTFLCRAFTGEKVSMRCDSFDITGFRLGVSLTRPPQVLIAGLRPEMLRLAGRVGSGAILNWLSPQDVQAVVPYVTEQRADVDGDPEIVARIFVIPDPDLIRARAAAKRMIAAYLCVPVYEAQQRFLGRGDRLEPMWQHWSAGRRDLAVESVPDSVVDDLFVYGSPAACRRRIADYVTAGVTTPLLHLVGGDIDDPAAAVRSLGQLSL